MTTDDAQNSREELLAEIHRLRRQIELLEGARTGAVASNSDPKAEEAERLELEDQLRQSQKMEAVGRLAGGIAHDFNNLLTAILGFADVLGERLIGDEEACADLEEIRRAGETAASVTRQLLAFSRRQMISPRILVLNPIVTRSNRMLLGMIGENLTLSFTPDPALWEVCIDPAQVDQVLVNLSVNARDAMPQVGKLSLRTQNINVDGERCHGCGVRFDGEYVLLEVSDTGAGMDDVTISRLFEPFFTTKGKGTGLGLATVHGIVHQNNGHQVVSSVMGEGTRFQIFFPRSHGTDAARPDSGQLPQVAGGETVIVAEDQEVVQRLVVRMLEDSGYRVLAAGDGEEALRRAEKLEGAVDLLVTDVVMPNLNGKQLYDRLFNRWPELRVLYMSGYSGDSIAQHAALSPEACFIQKPFTAKALLRKVREALESPSGNG